MGKFRLLKLVNNSGVIGYENILMSVKDKTSIEFEKDSHLNISVSGFHKNDMEYIIEDYEITGTFIDMICINSLNILEKHIIYQRMKLA